MAKPEKSKRFVYNLATVLKVREIREQQQQDKYNEAIRKHEEEKLKEQQLRDEETEAYHTLRDMMGSKELPSLNKITMRKAHLDRLKEKIDEQEKITQEAEKKVEEERIALTEAVKKRKIMEKDKEKTRELWKKLMDKEEGKFLDDISTVGYERKRREE